MPRPAPAVVADDAWISYAVTAEPPSDTGPIHETVTAECVASRARTCAVAKQSKPSNGRLGAAAGRRPRQTATIHEGEKSRPVQNPLRNPSLRITSAKPALRVGWPQLDGPTECVRADPSTHRVASAGVHLDGPTECVRTLVLTE